MQSFLTSVSDPVWSNKEHTRIDCVITTSQFGEEKLPFTADKNDCEPHGRAIFADLISGKYGGIAEYVEQTQAATPTSGDISQAIL